ncbi:MAG TPA: cupin domain-containing protein [Candidatus Eremiobacteraceae bacterium]|nr:cupin domain-containing protein [Candidatus Eremiobacteraceae bacterium]
MNAMQFISIVLFSSFLLIPQKTFEDAPVPVEQEPHHHTVLKNDSVVVMRVTLREGERTLYHIHARDRVAVELSNCNISQQNLNEPEGPSAPTKPGDVSASTAGATPLIHRVHNFGPGTFEVLDVEFLHRPEPPSSAEAASAAGENPSARVYRWELAPGAALAMHTHARPYLIVATTKMTLKMTGADGQTMTHQVQAGDFHWIDAQVTHSLANEGTEPGQIIEVELK